MSGTCQGCNMAHVGGSAGAYILLCGVMTLAPTELWVLQRQHYDRQMLPHPRDKVSMLWSTSHVVPCCIKLPMSNLGTCVSTEVTW
jgi:hypothetical protein